jgi:hypothetical protein
MLQKYLLEIPSYIFRPLTSVGFFSCIGILEQSMEVRTTSMNRVVVPARQSPYLFVNLLRSPGIDFQPSRPLTTALFVVEVPQGYIGWRNRFLGSFNVYKYGLSLGTLAESIPGLLKVQKDQSPYLFVNFLRSPGIDFQPGGPVQQPYLS